MVEVTSINEDLKDQVNRIDALRGYFDLDNKQAHFKELTEKLNDPKLWEDPKKAQELNKEKVHLEKELKVFIDLEQAIKDASELSELAHSEKDEEALVELIEEFETNEKKL